MSARSYVVQVELRQQKRRRVENVSVDAYSAKDAAFQARIRARSLWSFARDAKMRVLNVAPQQNGEPAS